MLNETRELVFSDINTERLKQLEKWGDQRHSTDRWVAIMLEELGEAAKASLEGQLDNWREELVQIAAVAIAALEDFDRATKGM